MTSNTFTARWRLSASAIPLSLVLACCSEADVNLYVALDQEHSEALIRRFEEQTGLHVGARFDTEAQKTVGLVSAILEEGTENPRCDVFWNNELAHTVRLAQKGMLDSYASPSALGIPANYKDADNRWTGFAARARIFIVNKDRIKDPADYPTSLWDLTDPKWKGRCAIARPLTGTTLTHFTALRISMGAERFKKFWQGLHANDVQFLQSNGATMRRTIAKDGLDFALTDTDDFHVALTKGHRVAAVFPDQGESQMGTMLIPNSVAIVKNCRHPEAARKLVDFVLSEEVEALLAAAKSAQIPLRKGVRGPSAPSILTVGSFKQMPWDPAKTAADLRNAESFFDKELGKKNGGG